MNPSSHDQIKILIVDDSDFNRKSMATILTDEGYNVIGLAANAEEAIQIAHNSKPNLVLIDVVMPEISGLELCRHLLEKNNNDRYVIMMSSLTMDNIVIESIASGAIDFLQKPFERSHLLKAVHKVQQIIAKEK